MELPPPKVNLMEKEELVAEALVHLVEKEVVVQEPLVVEVLMIFQKLFFQSFYQQNQNPI
jgi:hypothetical protein